VAFEAVELTAGPSDIWRLIKVLPLFLVRTIAVATHRLVAVVAENSKPFREVLVLEPRCYVDCSRGLSSMFPTTAFDMIEAEEL